MHERMGTAGYQRGDTATSIKPGAVDRYMAEVERFETLIDRLEDRLATVLRPWMNEPSAAPQPEAVQAPIHELNERLGRQVNRLGELLDRIEL